MGTTASEWTPERLARAKALYLKGRTASQIAASLGGVTLLGYITLHPWIERNRRRLTPELHPQPDDYTDWTPPTGSAVQRRRA